MSSSIPQKLLDFISLSDLFDQLGELLHDDWSGRELNMSKVPTFEDACKLKEEESEKSDILKSWFGRSDDEYIKECWFIEEQTGYLTEEEDDYREHGWPNDLKIPTIEILRRLSSLRNRLSALPNLNDRENYDAQYELWERREETTRAIIDLLQNNKILVYCQTGAGRGEIDNDLWAALDVSLDVVQNEAHWPHLDDTKQGIHFKRGDAEILINDLKKQISSKAGSFRRSRRQDRHPEMRCH